MRMKSAMEEALQDLNAERHSSAVCRHLQHFGSVAMKLYSSIADQIFVIINKIISKFVVLLFCIL